jgi:NADPH:quinone reductase
VGVSELPATRRVVELERFGGPEVMRWAERPTPEPAEGQAVVAVEALGVNFGDSMVRRGEYRRDQPLDFTPGFEAAGRVLRSAPGAPPVGARVAVLNDNGRGYTDLLVVPAERVYEVPEEVPAEVAAALLIQGTTAWYSLHRFGALSAGETVLVNAGAGGVGSLAIQLTVAAGATAIASASTEAKLEIARGHGAAHAFLADPETLAAEVRGATDGKGVDVVVDGVGGDLVAPGMKALGFHGRYVVAGAASQQPGTYDTRGLMPRNQSIHGFVTARIIDRDPAEPRRALDAVLAAWSAGDLRPTYEVLDPEQIVEAHQRLESRERTGKIVIGLNGAGGGA